MTGEKDKKFDAALGGFLINDLRVRAEHVHCPESDVLAAYHERSLLPKEMNSWKEHIVGCVHCQAILAQLEATDSIPVHASEKEEVLVMGATASVAEPSPARKAAPAVFPEKSRGSRLFRGVRWQWLAPAGALAAGLLVWVAWHENQLPQVKAPAEIKTAKLEPPPTPPPAATQVGRESTSSDELARLSKDQVAIGGVASAKGAPESQNLRQLEKLDSRAKVARAEPPVEENLKRLEKSAPPADKERGLREDTGRDLVAANRAQNQPALDSKTGVAGAVSETVQVQAQAANAQIQTQQNQQNQLNEQKIVGPNPLNQTKQAKKAKSESPDYRYGAPQSAAAAPTAAFDENVTVSSALISGDLAQHLISAPGNKILWRVGHVGRVEFSSDAGASWSRQTSNVLVDLTSGSAPSEKVCWVVGRAGTILLTMDAGAHWFAIHSPLEEDLGGVRATDALHATIWSLRNTKTFETLDGGLTWKPVASP